MLCRCIRVAATVKRTSVPAAANFIPSLVQTAQFAAGLKSFVQPQSLTYMHKLCLVTKWTQEKVTRRESKLSAGRFILSLYGLDALGEKNSAMLQLC
ncbi:uncharacterized protein CCR75_002977 [Bremia lactucae]|uniref:Uncharacterized protein n=1 Tax=Bremia lactucae TaxID=4779 RepID=A0A976ILG5_BRELC|nr:hypothetical protein CCR75_002977 [Bremia lactucae]